MSNMSESKTPLILICGFLGSGKTTLVNRLLEEGFGGERTAVVVNDFGSVAVDEALIEHTEEGMLVLANGCICCSLASDLVRGLKGMLDAGRFDRIVMETSGITSVASLLKALESPAVAGRLVVERIITVVDAVRFTRIYQVVRVAAEQVHHADTIVLNYHGDAKPEQLAKTEEALRSINPQAPVIPTTHCQLTRAQLEIKDLARRGAGPAEEPVGDHWYTCRLVFSEPLARAELELALGAIPASVQRVKGFVREAGGGLLHIQRAGDSLNIEAWSGALPNGHTDILVAIGSSPIAHDLAQTFQKTKGVNIVNDHDLHAHAHHHH